MAEPVRRVNPPGAEGLYRAFRSVALAAPEAIAVVGEETAPTTYAELLRGVDEAAGLLAGLVPGTVLGLALADPRAFVQTYLAAAQLGMVTVLLDHELPAGELGRHATRFDVDVLAVDVPERPEGFELRTHGGPGGDGYLPGDFVVHCTSGSTGMPKGIVMSQQAITARVDHWSTELGLAPSDIVMCALPLAHCHGIDVLTLPTLLTGGTVVFARGNRLTARRLARLIEYHQVTVMSGLPLMYEMLTRSQAVSGSALRSMRWAISGSAPLPADVQRSFEERYGLPLRQVYGLSEIGVICFDRAYVGKGSVGLPISGVHWRLEPVPTTPDEPEQLHELYVRGPALARGYHRDPVAEAEMFQDGWLRTRDFLRVESAGWYVRGRQSGFINVAGSKVGPLEVETALRDCPGVRECAVVGVPDADGAEHVAALLVVDAGFDLAAARAKLLERLLSYQLPRHYRLADTLPRTSLGKVDYAAVRRVFEVPASSTKGKRT